MSKDTALLHPQMRFCDAAGPVILTRLDDVFAQEAGTRAGEDAEALHDMRVASRRLRAAMNVFEGCFPRRAFKRLRRTAARLTRALGEVRDRDVLLATLERYAKKAPAGEQVGVNDLIAGIRDERDTYRVTMLQVLDDVDRNGFRQQLQALAGARGHTARNSTPTASLREHAQRLSIEHVADLYGFVGSIHDVARAEELHEMRISAKHLRYVLEIFRPCFGPDIDDRIEEVKTIQEQIGQIHDCDVMVEVLRRHLSVQALRAHERLVALASEPVPLEERTARVRAALQEQSDADPRLGLLVLLGRKIDERARRYTDFVRWWDQQERDGMRGKLYACLTAPQGLAETA